jgi:NADH:ubiquinone oxidoreductase subunit C
MTNTELKEVIGSWSSNLVFDEESSEFLVVEVPASELREISEKLKTDSKTAFDYLFMVTGVDYGAELGVVYHIESTTQNHMIVMKVKTEDRENPNFDTISDIWPAAYYNESEVYDFFGIKFNGHKNLRRIFLDENWKGWPLRKDYKDEFNMLTK